MKTAMSIKILIKISNIAIFKKMHVVFVTGFFVNYPSNFFLLLVRSSVERANLLLNYIVTQKIQTENSDALC